jgi:hypothetical protein
MRVSHLILSGLLENEDERSGIPSHVNNVQSEILRSPSIMEVGKYSTLDEAIRCSRTDAPLVEVPHALNGTGHDVELSGRFAQSGELK